MGVVCMPTTTYTPTHNITYTKIFLMVASIQMDKLRLITTQIDFFLIDIVKVIKAQFSDCEKYYQIYNIQMILGRL